MATWSMRFTEYPGDVDADEIAAIAADVGVSVVKTRIIASLAKRAWFGWPPTLTAKEKALRSAQRLAGGCVLYRLPDFW